MKTTTTCDQCDCADPTALNGLSDSCDCPCHKPATKPATITLIDGYTKKPATYRVLTLSDVIAWSKPVQQACTFCSANGTIPITISNEWQVETFKLPIGTEHNIICGSCNGTKLKSVDTTPSHVWFVDIKNQARTAKINGKVRTWKRDASRVEVPLKYGLYEYVTFTTSDIESGRLILPM